ncbi:integrin alpha-M [Kryptolebias marmoratus]|uniref:integrin alpha-M n=1 Tax=Kryptolebias marmoratus TaxID=37003 RepID=UPI0018ACA8CD|nr:integrin alpha-M [Kryptolebias marmoratus]
MYLNRKDYHTFHGRNTMHWIISVTFFWSVFKAALCFNVDPVTWKSLGNPAAGFGYQVVQRRSDFLISAPLEQYSSNARGQIFQCTTERCQILPLPRQKAAVNMSLGLAMTSDPTTQNTLACGPTIPKDCKSITMYNGLCTEINQDNSFGRSYPSSTEDCKNQADIAFLLDGSGSVARGDFSKMKTFVKNLIGAFLGKDTQFAIIQFSSSTNIHYYFSTFSTKNWESQVDNINQLYGGTYTASAITTVVTDVFSPNGGSRSNVKKILIVITDGQSHDRNDLPEAVRLADRKKILRFSIGVGNAFNSYGAKQELNQIASSPPEQFVFQVENFEALDKIRNNLQDKFFSIEGSQTDGETLKLEMSQEGFRAAYIPGGIQMAVVGANQWKGGYKKYSLSNTKNTGSYQPTDLEPDSYLGYSMAVAKTTSDLLTILGAPRYKHRGAVMTVYRERFSQQIDPYQRQFQTGAYFGAEVCAMDVNSDSITDLILISAPMYMDQDREGRVYVCTLTRLNVKCHFDSPSQQIVLRGDPSDKGRFGSSLAVLPDLNRDRFNDLAIGAPLENNGQGSIYIFHGKGGGQIDPTYSQRIAASEVQSGLKFFGLSISQWSFDQSGDTLPDLAVGSKGTVVLLRSRPIVTVEATVSFNPKEIPTQNVDCTKPLAGTATICFTMRRLSAVNTAQAQINYTLTLDATRSTPNNRAYIINKQRAQTGSVIIDLTEQMCNNVNFSIEACPEDALNPLYNELSFTFDGFPSNTNLQPSLAQQAQRKAFYPIGFEISCGADMECTDNLKVDFNFTRSSEVKVGIDELLNVTVSVENRGENSYNSHIILTYPVGLSYRKFTSLHGRIECNSLDSEDGVTRGKTDCTVDKPIFKSNSTAIFIVSYGFNPRRQLERRIFVTANATSENQNHSSASELYREREIEVKYSIFITMESSLSYNNFTFGKNNLQKPFQQSIKVTNNIRALNFTVVIKVPVKLGDRDIWVDLSSFQVTDCQRDRDEGPVVTDFVAQIKETKIVDCSVARCGVFRCSRFMERLEEKTYTITANLSSGWIEQIGLPSAKFLLTSTASLEYNRNQFIFFSTSSNNTAPVLKIEAEVEVFPAPDFTKEIIGGSLGGLAFLLLLTAGLYKAGFFKSKYKDMIKKSEEAEGGPGTEEAAPSKEEKPK